jgi:membrane protein DedA with SNARE-associated domain
MPLLSALLARHAYAALMATVFLEAIGLPIPAALALMIAGAAVATHVLYAPHVMFAALGAMLAGDILMFLLGRYTGCWLLGILCRVSLNPESCILRSADSFYRRGRALLVVAKFIPGINTMAPPLAGSMNMRVATFLRLDLAGAALYVGCFLSIGYLFSDALAAVMRGYEVLGHVFGRVVIALVAAYAAFQLWRWIRARGLEPVALASPAEAAHAAAAGAPIYDVRSHGYLDANAIRIRGSRRLDPHAIHQGGVEAARDQDVYLYCTCVRQATSARVARELARAWGERSVRIRVIEGGLHAWRKAGLPLEPVPASELATLPLFA